MLFSRRKLLSEQANPISDVQEKTHVRVCPIQIGEAPRTNTPRSALLTLVIAFFVSAGVLFGIASQLSPFPTSDATRKTGSIQNPARPANGAVMEIRASVKHLRPMLWGAAFVCAFAGCVITMFSVSNTRRKRTWENN